MGCDISVYQGTVDFSQLSTVASFAIIRTTVGSSNNGNGTVFTDSYFASNRAGAEAAGMKVGFYHFANPIKNTAQKEATAFCNAIGYLKPGEFVALDYEVNYTGDVVAWCKEWMDDVAARLGVRSYIYLNLSLTKNYDWTPVIQAQYPLWLAYWDYNSQANPPSTVWPTVPIRQYSDNETMTGISDAVDGDVYYNYATAPWPGFHGDSQNMGTGVGSGATGNPLWSYTAGGGIYSSPAVDLDGSVYVGSLDGSVYAFGPGGGAPKWSYATGGDVYSSPALGQNGMVYFGSNDANVYSVNELTGVKNWAFATSGQVHSSPAVSPGGTVYVGSEDKNVYAINGGTGSQIWTYQTNGEVDGSPALGSDCTVYIGSADGYMYALNPATGAAKWSYNAGSPIHSSACVGLDGTVYFGDDAGNFYALNGSSATE
jgi:GH25 family lysozyme M1 (1,4-beta-N-acetylmuramidase)